MIEEWIERLARIIDLAGIAVIFWGVGSGLVGLVSRNLARGARADFFQPLARIRCQVGTYILLGLEILIASDIARTVVEPTYDNVILLGGIVAIRTALSFFLSRELESLASPG